MMMMMMMMMIINDLLSVTNSAVLTREAPFAALESSHAVPLLVQMGETAEDRLTEVGKQSLNALPQWYCNILTD
jgi:hypothetical protein